MRGSPLSAGVAPPGRPVGSARWRSGLPSAAEAGAGPLRLGHRGHRCPEWPEAENSLAAFDRALACGCDGLELDLRHTSDGRIVIHHDDELQCDSGPVAVAQSSLRSLRRLQPTLATLEQVLRRYRDRAWLDLEVKTREAAEEAARLVARYEPRRGFVLSSFEVPTLLRLAALDPRLPLCLNLRRPCSLRRLRELPIGWVAPHQGSCTGWYVRRLRARGWRVLVWTVNHPAKMRLLARAGADAVVSDLPELLMTTLARATQPAAPASFSEDEWNDGADLRRHPAASSRAGRVVSKS